MAFSAVEKTFIVYLFLGNLGQPWATGYLPAFLDSTIVADSIIYFISDHGRPQRWVVTTMAGRHS